MGSGLRAQKFSWSSDRRVRLLKFVLRMFLRPLFEISELVCQALDYIYDGSGAHNVSICLDIPDAHGTASPLDT